MSGDIGLILFHPGYDLALAFLTIFEKIKDFQPGGLSNSLQKSAFEIYEVLVHISLDAFMCILAYYGGSSETFDLEHITAPTKGQRFELLLPII